MLCRQTNQSSCCAIVSAYSGVAFATQNLGSFEEKNNEFANFQGKPLTYYIETFSK